MRKQSRFQACRLPGPLTRVSTDSVLNLRYVYRANVLGNKATEISTNHPLYCQYLEYVRTCPYVRYPSGTLQIITHAVISPNPCHRTFVSSWDIPIPLPTARFWTSAIRDRCTSGVIIQQAHSTCKRVPQGVACGEITEV